MRRSLSQELPIRIFIDGLSLPVYRYLALSIPTRSRSLSLPIPRLTPPPSTLNALEHATCQSREAVHSEGNLSPHIALAPAVNCSPARWPNARQVVFSEGHKNPLLIIIKGIVYIMDVSNWHRIHAHRYTDSSKNTSI